MSKAQSGSLCVCMPLHCQRNGPTGSSLDRPGARRAVTCATITSDKGLGVVASRNPSILHLKESRWRLRIVDEVVEACQRPIGECTGKFGLLTVDYYVDPAKRRYGCSLYPRRKHRNDISSPIPIHSTTPYTVEMSAPPPPPQWVIDLNSPPAAKPKSTGIPDPPGFTSTVSKVIYLASFT